MKSCACAVWLMLSAGVCCGKPGFTDATSASNLPVLKGDRVRCIDLNGDGRPDLIANDGTRHRVFLNRVSDNGWTWEEVANPNLPALRKQDVIAAADLDSDGHADVVMARYLDVNGKDYKAPDDTWNLGWMRGKGDGTFEDVIAIPGLKPCTTTTIAIGDVDMNGRLDLFIGNWYTRYGVSNEAFGNDLFVQSAPGKWTRSPLPTDGVAFDEEKDLGGRPCYGVMIVPQDFDRHQSNTLEPLLFELCYGRRWNRLWLHTLEGPWIDGAAVRGLDADADRSGKYPAWLAERAKTDARFKRETEKPYRTGGNTFDAAIGDVDNDGGLDICISEITHAWAGSSSDRTRILMSRGFKFEYEPIRSVDRVPADPANHSWNQGDIFCELADMDLDGRLDLVLCSSDYPDNQRLRIFLQQPDGAMVDSTTALGIDHEGAGQLSLADLDQDGDLDIVVCQSFNRLPAERTKGRTPHIRVWQNAAADDRTMGAITITLQGNPDDRMSRDALGAMCWLEGDIDGKPVKQTRALIGIGGCVGKQHQFLVHFGLGKMDPAARYRLAVRWPGMLSKVSEIPALPHGHFIIGPGGVQR